MIPHWLSRLTKRRTGGGAPPRRPDLTTLAQTDPARLPRFVRESAAAHKYLALLGELDWAHFPERAADAGMPGPRPAPRAPFVAAFLIRLDKGLVVMPKLREYLVEQPALVWLLGFPLVPSSEYECGFDVEQSLPGARIRHQLDRTSPAYTRLYNQRSATERINAQAVELGIERPKLRNQHAIARMNTLRYVLINLKGLQRIRQRQTALTAS